MAVTPTAEDSMLEMLLCTFGDAEFMCGKWRGFDPNDFERMLEMRNKAKQQLINYMENEK